MQFSVPEILSLLGLVQSVYVIVYMMFRSGALSHAVVPFCYFFFLGGAFLLDAAAGHWRSGIVPYGYDLFRWFFWIGSVPIGTLLIFQIATISEMTRARYYLILLLLPLAFAPMLFPLEEHKLQTLYVSGSIAGAVALLCVWAQRDILNGLHAQPRFGEERFWLIIALIAVNAAFIASTLAHVSDLINLTEWVLIRTLLGLGFVYLAATSLFRIYPQAFRQKLSGDAQQDFSDAENEILARLDALLEQDKIYQEASLGRAELARELGVGEAALSRIVNVKYAMTIPQMLNGLRVRDAQRLLRETDATIQNVFEESGFNSVTTFNRVFKELTGDSPKTYRARYRE